MLKLLCDRRDRVWVYYKTSLKLCQEVIILPCDIRQNMADTWRCADMTQQLVLLVATGVFLCGWLRLSSLTWPLFEEQCLSFDNTYNIDLSFFTNRRFDVFSALYLLLFRYCLLGWAAWWQRSSSTWWRRCWLLGLVFSHWWFGCTVRSWALILIWIDASSCIRMSVQPNFFCTILSPLDHQHLWLCSHCPLNFSGQSIEGASSVCVSSELLSHTDMIHLRGVD